MLCSSLHHCFFYRVPQATKSNPALSCAGSKQAADGSRPPVGGYSSVGGSDRDLHGLGVQVVIPAPLIVCDHVKLDKKDEEQKVRYTQTGVVYDVME